VSRPLGFGTVMPPCACRLHVQAAYQVYNPLHERLQAG
jgi:hypothetical protein